MIDKQILHSVLPYLKYAHGFFGGLVLLLFLYQGWMGLKIRNRRRSSTPADVTMVRGHRKLGPSLPVLVLFIFFGGISALYLSWGEYFEYPLHFVNGLTILILSITTFLISKKIRGRDATWRNIHYFAGLVILSLYFLQAYLGIRMLS